MACTLAQLKAGREKRERLRAEGMCLKSCRRKAIKGKNYCIECTEKDKERNKKRYQRK